MSQDFARAAAPRPTRRSRTQALAPPRPTAAAVLLLLGVLSLPLAGLALALI